MPPATPDNLVYESGLRAAGLRTIAGIDEVGRGALAGPVVAAAVVLPEDVDRACIPWRDIADSKVLSARKRSELAIQLHEVACHVSVSVVDPGMIDEVGIGPANRLAMECAVRGIECECDLDILLIDALTIDSSHPQIAIIGGDALSMSIAAASIVAKVHRDSIMTALAETWPRYGWDSNKGYGVAGHLEALRSVGPCEHHRRSFRPVFEAGAFHRA